MTQSINVLPGDVNLRDMLQQLEHKRQVCHTQNLMKSLGNVHNVTLVDDIKKKKKKQKERLAFSTEMSIC